MPGYFDPASLPKRPGVYSRYEAQGREIILPAFGSVVAVPMTHDWGPLEQPTLCNTFAQYLDFFGDSITPGYLAVRNAFLGESVDNRLGAGSVLVYRMGGSAAAKATKALTNATPVTAITLSAKYEGTRGANLRVTVQDYAADAAKDQLLLYYGSTLLESYVYANTDITDLAAQINATSDWITATVAQSGVALTVVSSVAFTTQAGNDGSTLLAQDWTDMMTRLGTERFSLFCPFDLTDSGILASIKTWLLDLNNHGRKIMAVVGGALDETVTTAIARSATLNSELFVNVGVGSYLDTALNDPATGQPYVLSSSQLATRVAGILAQKGDSESATMAYLGGITIRTGPTEANIDSAFDGGVVVIARDNDPVAPTHLERSLTTYTTTTDPAKPYLIFRNPKFVRTLHIFEDELQTWQRQLIGPTPVNDKSRRALVAEAKARLNARVGRGIIQPDPTVYPSTNPPPSDFDEFLAVTYGVAFGRSVEQVFNTIRFQ